MEKINTMQELINWFEGLADGSIKPFNNKHGLCSQVDVVYGNYTTDEFISKWGKLIEMGELDDTYESWDKFSGRHCYPVPAPECEDGVEGITCPEEMYLCINNDLNMWEGAYGNLRKDLCRHVANELRKLL